MPTGFALTNPVPEYICSPAPVHCLKISCLLARTYASSVNDFSTLRRKFSAVLAETLLRSNKRSSFCFFGFFLGRSFFWVHWTTVGIGCFDNSCVSIGNIQLTEISSTRTPVMCSHLSWTPWDGEQTYRVFHADHHVCFYLVSSTLAFCHEYDTKPIS